jgi:hypothetical protein
MALFTPKKATGTHFYKYQSAEHLDRLRPVILEHRIYVPLAAQLNDPNDCRPKLRSLSEDEMISFLRTDYINQNPVLALDLLRLTQRGSAPTFKAKAWSGSIGSSPGF